MFVGLGTIVIFCLMNIVPHFLYGPGEDALALTVEYGSKLNSDGAFEALEKEDRKTLCNSNGMSQLTIFILNIFHFITPSVG